MEKSNEIVEKKALVGKHSCVVNGPEWGDSDIVDSDDGMETSQGSGRMREKMENNLRD